MNTRKLSIVFLMAIISIKFLYSSLASAQGSELLIVTDEEKQNGYLVEIK